MGPEAAVHSDLLVHWTGHDFDKAPWDEQSGWTWHDSLANQYFDRLWSILRFGLWMKDEHQSDFPQVPPAPRVCFTELKVSQSMTHAREYGRLGIAVKRPYVLRRGGRPVVYYRAEMIRHDQFLQHCLHEFTDQRLLHYFKEMGRRGQPGPANYDYFSESEWRIVYTDDLLTPPINATDVRNYDKGEWSAYVGTLNQGLPAALKYLLPLDGWLAAIIYPSLDIKNRAQQKGSKVRNEIERIKTNMDDHANKVEGSSWPMELDIDVCRNL
jgi:hypothetical protein